MAKIRGKSPMPLILFILGVLLGTGGIELNSLLFLALGFASLISTLIWVLISFAVRRT